MFEFCRNGPGKVLHDRPGSISTELVAPRVIEFFDGTNQ